MSSQEKRPEMCETYDYKWYLLEVEVGSGYSDYLRTLALHVVVLVCGSILSISASGRRSIQPEMG